MSQPQGTESQGDFQDFTSLPDTIENDDIEEDDNPEEVEDSGMDAGIDSGSEDDADDDMIVLDPEHVSEIKLDNHRVDATFLTAIQYLFKNTLCFHLTLYTHIEASFDLGL